MDTRNFIDKLFFELQYQQQEEKFLLPEKVKEKFYNDILPVIEKVFDTVPDHIHIRLSEFTIDAGKVNIDELKQLVESRLTEMVNKEIKQQHSETEKKSLSNKIKKRSEKTNSNEIENDLSLLIYFLKTGLLPWYTHNPLQVNIQELIKKITGVQTHNIKTSLTNEAAFLDFKTALKKLFLTETARKRIIIHFEPATVLRLMGLINTGITEKTVQSLSRLLGLFAEKEKYTAVYEKLIAALVNILLVSNPSVSSFKEIIEQKSIADILEPFFSGSTTTSVTTALEKLLKEEKTSLQKMSARLKTKNIGSAVLRKNTANATNLLNPEKTDAENNSPELNNGIPEAVNDGIAVTNAGLVILSPFLPYFFDALALTKNGVFKNERHAVKAAQVLHYIVSGKRNTPEYLLPLNKIICGVPLDTPVPARLTITGKIKTEAANLVDNVLSRCPAFRNTSAAGFTGTFLNRDGILRKNENDWTLFVEPKAFDMLLDDLPWGINFIKMKWNDYILHTEWDRL